MKKKCVTTSAVLKSSTDASNSVGVCMKEKAIQDKASLKEEQARKQEETKCEMAENKGKSKHNACNILEALADIVFIMAKVHGAEI